MLTMEVSMGTLFANCGYMPGVGRKDRLQWSEQKGYSVKPEFAIPVEAVRGEPSREATDFVLRGKGALDCSPSIR